MNEALRCAKGKEDLFPFYGEQYIAEAYLDLCGLKPVDYDKGTADLDTPEMKTVQEICKSYFLSNGKTLSGFIYENRALEDIMENKTIFYPSDSSHTFALASQLLGDGIESTILPVRGIDGKIRATVDLTTGMRNNSPNPQNTNDFLRLLIGDVFQMNIGNSLPILIRGTYDKVYQIKTSSLDGYGNGMDFRWDGTDYVTKPLPDETYDLLIQWVNEIGSAGYTNPTLHGQMAELFKPYYKGGEKL